DRFRDVGEEGPRRDRRVDARGEDPRARGHLDTNPTRSAVRAEPTERHRAFSRLSSTELRSHVALVRADVRSDARRQAVGSAAPHVEDSGGSDVEALRHLDEDEAATSTTAVPGEVDRLVGVTAAGEEPALRSEDEVPNAKDERAAAAAAAGPRREERATREGEAAEDVAARVGSRGEGARAATAASRAFP